jgi:hypothetical protein
MVSCGLPIIRMGWTSVTPGHAKNRPFGESWFQPRGWYVSNLMAYRVNFPDSFAGQPLRGQAGENPVMYATQWRHRAQLSRPRSCAIRLIFLALSIVIGIAAGGRYLLAHSGRRIARAGSSCLPPGPVAALRGVRMPHSTARRAVIFLIFTFRRQTFSAEKLMGCAGRREGWAKVHGGPLKGLNKPVSGRPMSGTREPRSHRFGRFRREEPTHYPISAWLSRTCLLRSVPLRSFSSQLD